VNLDPMIPANEVDTLMMTVTDAIDLAADGQVSDGHACLVWGLHSRHSVRKLLVTNLDEPSGLGRV
jgi:hypothetical protein